MARIARRGPGPAGVVVLVAGALIATSVPVFLVSALSPRIGAELGLGEATLGVAVAAFFLAAAAASLPAGMLADRRGSSTALRAGLLIVAGSSIGVTLVASSGPGLIGWLVVGGASIGFVDTGGARAIAAVVPNARHGLAFGVKEASIPAASMLAGVSVPLLGERFGWRPAFAAAAVFAVLLAVTLPPGLDRQRVTAGDPPELAPPAPAGVGVGRSWPLLALSLTAALGGGAATAAATFLVPSSVAAGWSANLAGLLLAGASAVGVAVRLSVGSLADRTSDGELRILAGALAVGTVGVLTLATGSVALAVPGAVLAIGGGWGWTGLLFLAAVRTAPDAPAKAAGTVLVGLAAGGAGGPLAFGWLAGSIGFAAAWAVAGTAMASATVLAVTAHAARRRLATGPTLGGA